MKKGGSEKRRVSAMGRFLLPSLEGNIPSVPGLLPVVTHTARIPCMLYWECKRRLALLREFRLRAVDYFENIEYAGWMAGGAPRPMNEAAQKARHDMNRMLGEVLISLSRLTVPHVVSYQPPPRLGGYPQNVDVILNIFSLWEFQIGPERIFDTVDRAIGAYERECEKLFRRLFNPLYWMGMLVVQFLRIPSKLRGAGENDDPGTDRSLFGSMRQGWSGWNRTDKLTLLAIVVTVIVGAAAVVIPELRRMLHLDNTATAPVRASQAPQSVLPAPAIPNPTPAKKQTHSHAATKGKAPGLSATASSQPPSLAQDCAPGASCAISSGQQGGITAGTVNIGPPDPKVRWTAESKRLPQGQDPLGTYQVTVHIMTDKKIDNPAFTIECDAPCSYRDHNLGTYAMMGSNRQINDRTVWVSAQSLPVDGILSVVLVSSVQFSIKSVSGP